MHREDRKVKTEMISLLITPEMKQRMVIATRDLSVKEGRMITLSELMRLSFEKSFGDVKS